MDMATVSILAVGTVLILWLTRSYGADDSSNRVPWLAFAAVELVVLGYLAYLWLLGAHSPSSEQIGRIFTAAGVIIPTLMLVTEISTHMARGQRSRTVPKVACAASVVIWVLTPRVGQYIEGVLELDTVSYAWWPGREFETGGTVICALIVVAAALSLRAKDRRSTS